MSRKKILMEVGEILDTFCHECLVKKTLRKEMGKKYAQSFCIKECTVGQDIKRLGEQLDNK
ncbi:MULTISPECIES: zinc-finger domain-containing protein [Bacillus]|uniref:zinc-finger domain-containing protein n=1 Tax=Bacillus TaxID=1386 RepID=UPI000BB8A4F0|nr:MULTISPECIES: zinc-finger domain-containing protein [Bacillus]